MTSIAWCTIGWQVECFENKYLQVSCSITVTCSHYSGFSGTAQVLPVTSCQRTGGDSCPFGACFSPLTGGSCMEAAFASRLPHMLGPMPITETSNLLSSLTEGTSSKQYRPPIRTFDRRFTLPHHIRLRSLSSTKASNCPLSTPEAVRANHLITAILEAIFGDYRPTPVRSLYHTPYRSPSSFYWYRNFCYRASLAVCAICVSTYQDLEFSVSNVLLFCRVRVQCIFRTRVGIHLDRSSGLPWHKLSAERRVVLGLGAYSPRFVSISPAIVSMLNASTAPSSLC